MYDITPVGILGLVEKRIVGEE